MRSFCQCGKFGFRGPFHNIFHDQASQQRALLARTGDNLHHKNVEDYEVNVVDDDDHDVNNNDNDENGK